MTDNAHHGTMIHPSRGEETAVYRLYDIEGRLLYVGISRDPMSRWRQHHGKHWWARVASYAVDWFADLAAAARAESDVIRRETPVVNRPGDTVKQAVNTAAGRAAYKADRDRYNARIDAAIAAGPGDERAALLREAREEYRRARSAYRSSAVSR